jgi:hypothetical protein
MTHSIKMLYTIRTYTSDGQERDVFGWFEAPTLQVFEIGEDLLCPEKSNITAVAFLALRP